MRSSSSLNTYMTYFKRRPPLKIKATTSAEAAKKAAKKFKARRPIDVAVSLVKMGNGEPLLVEWDCPEVEE